MAFAGLVAACSSPQPEPRSFFFFMEDGIAREGVLARCNRDRDATAQDEECNNARRAASALAVEQERARRAALEAESERKLLAMRARVALEAETRRQAEAAAQEAEKQAYEDQWRGPSPPAFEIAAITPPSSEVIIASPELDLEELATIPRPFRTAGVPQ